MSSGLAFTLGLVLGTFTGMFVMTLIAFISIKIKQKKMAKTDYKVKR